MAATCTRVNLDKIVTDGRYQRPVEDKRVERMVRNFDAKQLGTVELSKRDDGSFAIIDGQHRIAALKALGRKQVPAIVHEGLGAQGEGELFVAINMGRKQLRPAERFFAQVFSGEEDAVAISNAVTGAGFSIAKFGTESSKNNPTSFNCIAALEQSHRMLGDDMPVMLQALRDTWYNIAGSTEAPIVRAYAILWNDFGDRITEQHVERLSKRNPFELTQNARVEILKQGLSVQSGGRRGALDYQLATMMRNAMGLRGESGRKTAGLLPAPKREVVEA
jgi:hypothetical protein